MSPRPAPRILVAVDFSDASAAALRMADRLSRAMGARLTALHAEVVDVPPYFTHDQLDAVEREVHRAREVASGALRDFVQAHAQWPADLRLVQQNAVDAIVDESRDADLLVLGTHGRRGPKRWWLGSVAERVVREVAIPAVVVHSDALQGDGRVSAIAIEGPTPETVQHWAKALSQLLSAPVQAFPSLDTCDSRAVIATSLVVVGMPVEASARSVHETLVSLGRTCRASVLFVPSGVAAPVPEAPPAH